MRSDCCSDWSKKVMLQRERKGRAEKAQGLSVNGLNNSVGCHGARAGENQDLSVLFDLLPKTDVFMCQLYSH